jgi:hypothetical protein
VIAGLVSAILSLRQGQVLASLSLLLFVTQRCEGAAELHDMS